MFDRSGRTVGGVSARLLPRLSHRVRENLPVTLTAQQREDIRSMQVENFRQGVEHHYANHPSTWRVRKAFDGDWRIVNADGVHVSYVWSFPTKKAALADIDPDNRFSVSLRMWNARTEWYEGRSKDPRSRKLEPWESEIVAQVLAKAQP